MYSQPAALARRRLNRASTSFPAECHIGEVVLLGTVYDRTDTGVFFKPELHLTDGRFYGKSGGDDAAAIGTEVSLHLVNPHAANSDVVGTVRWTGFSDAHGCAGLGVEVEAASMKRSA